MELRIKRAPRIDIEITVPGDKSISHRAVVIAALSNGVCTLRGFLPSEDCMHTVNALRALGIKIEQPDPATMIVHGKKRVLTPPKSEINCGNSGTTMRLLAGLLPGRHLKVALSRTPGCQNVRWSESLRRFVKWVQILSRKVRKIRHRCAFRAVLCVVFAIDRLSRAHR